MHSSATGFNNQNDIEFLDRLQLIQRLREVEEKYLEAINGQNSDQNLEDCHDLQVHKIELEMQNRHLVETQLQLEDSRNRYAELYENCPAGLATVSTSGRIIRVNSTTARAFGQNKPSLLGSIFARFIVPEDRRQFTHGLRQCFYGQSKVNVEVEVSMVGNDGHRRMHLTMHNYKSAEAQAPAAAISMVDVSAQYQLKERAAFIASAGEQFSINLDLRCATNTILNMATPQLADLSAISYYGEHLIDESSDTPDMVVCDKKIWPGHQKDSIYALLARSQFGEKSIKTHRHLQWDLNANCEWFTDAELTFLLEHNIRRVESWPLTRRGELLAMVWLVWSDAKDCQSLAVPSVLHDFVHRAALCLDNVSLYRLAQSQIKARSEFLAVVAHDLRNPLTAILMRAERMVQPNKLGDTAFVQKSAQAIGHCANKMASLVRDLLDSTSMDSRRLSVSPEAIAIGDILDTDLIGHRALLAHEGLEFIEMIDTHAQVYCDPRRINQVIENLIGNAAKFTKPGGKVVLSTHTLERSVQFSVKDSGCGIDKSCQQKVFDAFWQANQAGSISHGAGLGLNICKKIITASGGSIWLESEVGKGTTFFFTLPKNETIKQDDHAPLTDAAQILLVDDDESYREVMHEYLIEQGYSVSLAENGQRAIEWIAANGPPSLILLDLQMPEMDGLSFLKARAANEVLTAIPVTVLSAAESGLNVSQLAKTRVLSKETPLQDVLRAISTVQRFSQC